MSEFKMNDDGELVDESGDVVADLTAVSIANTLKAALQKYDNGRTLFIDNRDAQKVNGASSRVIFEKVSRVSVSDEVSGKYHELISQFVQDFSELQEESQGVLTLLFNDCQKGGRLYEYLIGEATEVASGLKVEGVVPTIEELQKMNTKVRGLWTALFSSVDSVDAIKALGVPCELTTKGRADGTTWVVKMAELPKVRVATAPDKISVVYCDGKEIWRTGTDLTLSNAVSLLKLKWADFERTMQLSAQLDAEGNEIPETQQDIWTINFTLDKRHFKSEVIVPETKKDESKS